MEKDKDKINVKNINEVVFLSKKLLKILYVIAVILGVYAVIKIGKELGVMKFITEFLKILLPLFIGLGIAWLFNPLVRKLESKGIRRSIGTTVIYIIFIGLIALILFAIIPSLATQIQELVKQIPTIGDSVQKWIIDLLSKLNIEGVDVDSLKLSLISKVEELGSNLSSGLPAQMVNIVTSIFSSLGTFMVGLIIGFYALLSFEHPAAAIEDFLPKRMRKNFSGIAQSINETCRNFINGSLIDCFAVFVITSIGLWLIGLKSPLLFGLFCGITNIIPYAGPYIGGVPAVIVGLAQDPITGILALVVISVIQTIEGNLFQPVIMSKTTKLHPITVLVGLIVFGHFWGVIGMVISTPVIGAIKAVIMYFDDKYDILNFN